MSDYNGVGYSGSINTVGDPNQGIGKIQDFMLGNLGFTPQVLVYSLGLEVTAANLPVSPSVAIGNYFASKGFPKNLDDLILGFKNFLNITYNTTLNTTDLEQATSYNFLLANFDNPLKEANSTVYTSDGVTRTTYDNLPQDQKDKYAAALLKGSFADFASKFVYKPANLSAGELDDGPRALSQYINAFQNYNQAIVGASSVMGALGLDMFSFYKAYFETSANTGQTLIDNFNTFFANFVYKFLGNPAAVVPVKGSEDFFSPSILFDKWTTEVTKNYAQANPTSWAPNDTTSASSAKKTMVLQRIFSLLVAMIQTLQKVTASQADRLGLMTHWQSAYTNLQNQVKFAYTDSPGFWLNFINKDKQVEKYNSLNTTFTESIKARKEVVSDEAKNLQTSINQSNDGVNQQSSLATSILQELTTIFSAIYR